MENRLARLPDDILYNIYFYINDYCTASNFWLLRKDFNKKYMTKYNKTYKHKFMLLFNSIFTRLSSLTLKNNIPLDREVVESITIFNRNNDILHNDIYFIYTTVKNFFIYYLTSGEMNPFYFNIYKKISFEIMLSGVAFLLDNIDITFNKNYVKIINKYNKPTFLESVTNLEKYYTHLFFNNNE
jgi:hypothetical protein